ncbi:cationic trypsin [Scaptodrosophila lebanonensis]|uniref:Cationic trypsin n=1 Tax=Drosophila lebanonensis TaxID=7225 RepID=A0A6J2U0F9_DROLE|nr:cationic trypsin [Scaptodrosophila lebanonensis]
MFIRATSTLQAVLLLLLSSSPLLFGQSAAASAPRSALPLRPRFDEDPGRIINGTLATMEATRHQVSLRRRLNDGYFFGTGHICGGSLIRPNVVLSAAHCFVDQIIYDGTFISKDDLIVVMGNLDRFNQTNTLVFDIVRLVLQVEKFDLSTYNNDIALIFLSGSAPTNHPTVRPIPLTEVALDTGTVCQVTGWGLTEEGYSADFLMTVDVPLISGDDCKSTSELGDLVGPGMVCAGYLEGERDACSGDSGGPLVCQSKLAGVVSWGIGCAEPLLPGVYTEVSYYFTWIEERIAEYENEQGSGSGEEGSGEEGSGEEGSGEEGSGEEGSGEEGSGSGSGDGDGANNIFVNSFSIAFPIVVSITHFVQIN